MTSERPRLYVHPAWSVSIVTGRHRARFLHAMTTASLSDAATGKAGFGLMASATGRHIGQFRFAVLPDAIALYGAEASLAAVLAALERHRVADDVRWTPPAPVTRLSLFGGAPVVPFLSNIDSLSWGESAKIAWEDVDVDVHSVSADASELSVSTLDLYVSPQLAPRLRVRLLSAGAEPLDEEHWQRARVSAGWPLDGADLGADDVALASSRLAATIGWGKGCFLGQEVFVRARDRGALPKRLYRVAAPAAAVLPQPPHALLDAEHQAQGVATSWTRRPTGEWLGLAMLKRKAVEAKTAFTAAESDVPVAVLPP